MEELRKVCIDVVLEHIKSGSLIDRKYLVSILTGEVIKITDNKYDIEKVSNIIKSMVL